MTKRKTHEEFIEEIKILHPNIEVLSQYITAKIDVYCRCKIDNYEWYANPHEMTSRKRGCPICAKKIPRHQKKHETFIEEMKKLHPNIEVLGKYTNSKKEILCRCLIDGYEWENLPTYLLDGTGCPKCSKSTRWTQKTFVAEMLNINPNIKIKGIYKNIDTPILCKCLIDGYEWDAVPYRLLYKKAKCPKCNNKILNISIGDKFILKMKELHPNIKVLDDYIDNKTPIKFECMSCGYIFIDKPTNIKTRIYPCSNCKDNMSMPEKIMRNVLMQLKIEYICQLSQKNFKWIKYGKKYDFLFTKI